MRDIKIINAIKKLETIPEQHKAFTCELLPKLNQDASNFELSKVRPTYGGKVLMQLLSILNQDSKGTARLLVQSQGYTEVLLFKDEAEALYAKRKLKKIARLAFTSEIKFTIESVA